MSKRLHAVFALLAILMLSGPGYAMTGLRIDFGDGTIVHDNGPGDFDSATGIILFDHTSSNFTTYGRLSFGFGLYGRELRLTRFQITSTASSPINGKLRFWSDSFSTTADFNISLRLHLSGSYTNPSGTVTGATASLTGYMNGGEYARISDPGVTDVAAPASFSPADVFTLWNPGMDLVFGGTLGYALSGNGDGINLPDSAALGIFSRTKPVPEPASWLLLLGGILALLIVRNRVA